MFTSSYLRAEKVREVKEISILKNVKLSAEDEC
jgi:hypothetical protein